MAKTTLKPWPTEGFLLEVESTDVLSEKEKAAVSYAIQIAFSMYCKGNERPSIDAIKQAINDFNPNPELVKNLISAKYC